MLGLRLAPLVILPVAGARPLRIPGVYQVVGIALFFVVAVLTWHLVRGDSHIPGQDRDAHRPVAGVLLMLPFAWIALLWVGLGTPWDATPPENVMRYSVLLAAAVAVTLALALLRDACREAHLPSSARVSASLGSTANLLAGATYVTWISYQLGMSATLAATSRVPDGVAAVSNVLDTALFSACALTYLATACFAMAMRHAGWLSPTGARGFVVVSAIAFVFLCIRGLSFPDPTNSASAWYLQPGFIAGIPAMPWIMPYYLGVTALATLVDPRYHHRNHATAAH